MPKEKTKTRAAKEQLRAFRTKAREIGADESGRADDVMKLLAKQKRHEALDEKHGYRGVMFAVGEAGGPDEWSWAIYPAVGSGIKARQGKIKGAREKALEACRRAIDSALEGRQ